MGSRGSEYRNQDNVVTLFKEVDKAWNKAFPNGDKGTKSDYQAWSDALQKLEKKGLKGEYLEWLEQGSPDKWTSKTKQEGETEDNWWAQQDADMTANESRNDVDKAPQTETVLQSSNSDDGAPYSQERKDNALWTTDKKKVDDALRQASGDLYPNFDKATKDAFQSYTGSGYVSINSALGHDTVGDGYLKNKIDRLTSALDKAELPVDMWLQRGISNGVASSMFGSDFSVGHIQQMIDTGQIIDNKPFMSTSGVKGAGFTSQDIILNIYAPKGTKAIYAEPFAVHGNGQYDWDGKSGQSYFSGEFEVMIQRGAQMRPLKVTQGNGKVYIDLQIEGFKYE